MARRVVPPRYTAHYGGPGTAENGWPAVMNYLKYNDEGTMQDYSDDIDALLVLAGLFSAVLTAFIVESYTMLQEDNADTSVKLLTQISSQLDSFHIQTPFVNSTAAPLSPPPPFRPTSAARWINVLWFISLLFSLAAAVIGILVKQWIREYHKWNIATASPRENVLVRQIRYEAWEMWQTVAIISSIPAMLELAVVLFVCGLIVFLWTVDVIVAIATTVFAAVFLIAVSMFTLLPAFFKRCPYKSPTAWACVLAVAAIRRVSGATWRLFLAVVSAGAPSWELYRSRVLNNIHALLNSLQGQDREISDWRQRDIVGGCAKTPPDGHERTQTFSSLMNVVQIEMSDISTTGSITSSPSNPFLEQADLIKPQATRIASEPIHLFNALIWTAAVSQGEDYALLDSLQQCAQALHRPIKLPRDNNATRASKLSVMRGIKIVTLWTLFDDLFSPSSPPASIDKEFNPVIAVRRWLYARYDLGASGPQSAPRPMIIYPEPEDSSEATLPLQNVDSESHQARYLFSVMLAQEIKDSVEEMLSLGVWHKADDQLFIRRVAELLSALQYATHVEPFGESQHLKILLDTYNFVRNSPAGERFDFMFPGLRAALLAVVWRCGTVWVNDSRSYSYDSKPAFRLEIGQLNTATEAAWYPTQRVRMGHTSGTYTEMWINLAASSLVSTASPLHEDCYTYHIIVSNAVTSILKAQGEADDLSHQFALVLDKMDAVMKATLRLGWKNGGTYDGRLPWLELLLENECLVTKTLYQYAPREVKQLLDTLESSVQLITNGEISVKTLRTAVDSLPTPRLETSSLNEPYYVEDSYRRYSPVRPRRARPYDGPPGMPVPQMPQGYSRAVDGSAMQGVEPDSSPSSAAVAVPPGVRHIGSIAENSVQEAAAEADSDYVMKS